MTPFLGWVPFNAPMKTVISTTEAPGAIGPYSQGIATGSFVFCSGQIPLDPATGQLVGDDVSRQTEQVLKNIAAVLGAQGLGLEHVVKTTVFMTDLAKFDEMNKVYGSYFPDNPPPAQQSKSQLCRRVLT